MGISAFVGFSFSEGDENIRHKVEKALDTVKQAIPGFSWESALSAESGDLKDKILNKIQGKNTFIGVCTIKESVVEHKGIKRPWWAGFFKKYAVLEKKYLNTKTSDWLIQEIGIAIGKEMKIILLVEKGLKRFGELQGNVERIEFSRDNLDIIFQKLTETISSLVPKTKSIDPPNAEMMEGAKEESNTFSEEKMAEITTPKPDWKLEQYKYALLICFRSSRPKEEGIIVKSFEESNISKEKHSRTSFKAHHLFLKYLFNKADTATQLKELVNNNLDNYDAIKSLIRLLEEQEQLDQAASLIEEIVSKEICKPHRTKLLLEASEVALKNGDPETALKKLLIVEKLDDLEECDKVSILSIRAEIAKYNNDIHLFCYLTEIILHKYPDDTGLRFNLAYNYDEIKYHMMALQHYRVLNAKQPDNETYLNNTGVTYSKLELRGKSISAYEKSANCGCTLATSNLAEILKNSGFINKAESLCLEASTKESCDPRVFDTLRKIDATKKDESKKETDVLKDSRSIGKILSFSEKAMLKPKLQDGEYRFSGDKISPVLKIKGYKVIGNYQYETTTKPIIWFQKKECVTVHTIKIRGEAVGRTIVFSEKEDSSNDLISGISKKNGIITFSEDLSSAQYTYLPEVKTQQLSVEFIPDEVSPSLKHCLQ